MRRLLPVVIFGMLPIATFAMCSDHNEDLNLGLNTPQQIQQLLSEGRSASELSRQQDPEQKVFLKDNQCVLNTLARAAAKPDMEIVKVRAIAYGRGYSQSSGGGTTLNFVMVQVSSQPTGFSGLVNRAFAGLVNTISTGYGDGLKETTGVCDLARDYHFKD